mmetsp:Transcript_16842/g.25321  ORF Transcript_16842/g.25321 Transcript_16842/m.25321 type:complete len:263 (+) Transcript_16842:132-920(+)
MKKKKLAACTDDKKDSRTIKVFSWNVACCEPSSLAPSWWSKNDSLVNITSIILQSGADIVALQESPLGIEASIKEKYSLVASTTSHAPGYVMLFVRKSLKVDKVLKIGPTICCEIQMFGKRIGFCNVHLAPFKQGETARKVQVLNAMKAFKGRLDILAGDCNMRMKEGKDIEDRGYIDVWKSLGRISKLRFTWDSKKNWYHGDPSAPGAFGFTCRFDRIYVNKDAATARYLKLIGEEPILGMENSFLSDHYGLLATLSLNDK